MKTMIKAADTKRVRRPHHHLDSLRLTTLCIYLGDGKDRYLKKYIQELSKAGINNLADLAVTTPDELFTKVHASRPIRNRILDLAKRNVIPLRM